MCVNYTETLAYLFEQLPMFSRLGAAAYKKDLTNIRQLCQHLGHPEQRFKTIHVGGTNGKGSVSHMLAATLQTAGYRTGLYTSPHLYDFRERIRLNGQLAEEDFVVAFVEKMKPLIGEISPSFFEITVAMAFAYFAEKGVEVAVIEVGLGGRLDSTNIIRPELSVITNIGWDHMNLLGDTLDAIAREKAGIIKPGVPVVIGERGSVAKQFITAAEAVNAPIYFAQDHYATRGLQWKDDILIASVERLSGLPGDLPLPDTYFLDLQGVYQGKNICTVLQSVDVLRHHGFRIHTDAVKKALYNSKQLTGLHGRWEVIRREPAVVLDVAHNEDGLRQLVLQLKHTAYKNLHLVVGMVKDKAVDSVLPLLPAPARYYFSQASIPRALAAEELRQKAAAAGLEGAAYPNVNAALDAALAAAGEDDLVLVCGSIFLVAEVDRERLAQPT